jgi:predicted NAD-dependent protein-ADP-ribosyltransferase YbiA (DUF1768 family)
MVQSKINPEINYPEKKTLEPEDKGHSSTLYVIYINEIPVLIVLGKEKYTYSNKDVVYFPIYIVSEDKIKSQIGLYESPLVKTVSLVDEDGDIDIEKMGEPLLFSFVNEKYIQKSNTNPEKYLKEYESMADHPIKPSLEKAERERAEKEKAEKEEEYDDETDVMKIRVPKSKVSEEVQKINSTIDEGVFVVDKYFKQPPLLQEETETDADKIKVDYKESASNQWIEKFMKNNNYDITDNEGGGDCLFAVIRDAFETIGQKTTVQKLRALVASQVDEEAFEEHRKLYIHFENEKQELTKKMKEIKKTNDIYMQRIKKIEEKQEKEKIIQEVKKMKEDYDEKMKEYKETKKLQEYYVGYMNKVDTLDKYREYILSSDFWADAWAISTLEYHLKIKMIILSQEAYKEKAYDNVLNCGEINKNLKEKRDFKPNYYIITSYSGDHYKLVSYKKKTIFTFKEIPYDIRILIVNKCLEKNAGIYYLVQDFRNFKTKLGLNPDEGNPEQLDEIEDSRDYDNYDHSVVFVFHSKSLDAKPGKGAGETIDKNIMGDYVNLSKIKDWRKKLHDSWSEAPFTIDGHRWASVEHYVQAAKFKKGFPDFFLQFSLDTSTELSKDPELAVQVADLKKAKFKEQRPKNVKVDVDYNLGRDLEERTKALDAKFSQNADLQQLLRLTKTALLKEYLRRKPAEPDILLMKIREQK